VDRIGDAGGPRGLSDSLRATFKAAAEERKLGDKWAGRQYALERGCVLDDIDARDLREKVWKAFKNRG